MRPRPVIDDNNWAQFLSGPRGFVGMGPCASGKPFADLGIDVIPESEWDDRIRQQEKDRATLVDLCNDLDLPHKDQQRTNYCWVYGPTHCLEIMRLQETGRVFNYSAASAGAPIKNFRNVGGWGDQALEYFIENGINLTDDWPNAAISSRYYTTENKEKQKLHRAIEYFVPRSWEEMGSLLLNGIPCGVGYNWWSHLVCATGLTLRDHNLIIRNSWAGWGDNGFGELSGRRKYPDGIVAITSMMPV